MLCVTTEMKKTLTFEQIKFHQLETKSSTAISAIVAVDYHPVKNIPLSSHRSTHKKYGKFPVDKIRTSTSSKPLSEQQNPKAAPQSTTVATRHEAKHLAPHLQAA
jgi:hypothetical protein